MDTQIYRTHLQVSKLETQKISYSDALKEKVSTIFPPYHSIHRYILDETSPKQIRQELAGELGLKLLHVVDVNEINNYERNDKSDLIKMNTIFQK